MGARTVVATVEAIAVCPPRLFEKRLRNGRYRRGDVGLEKRCSKCREYWPADNTAFYPQLRERDGLSDWCKACYLQWRGKWEARREAA